MRIEVLLIFLIMIFCLILSLPYWIEDDMIGTNDETICGRCGQVVKGE